MAATIKVATLVTELVAEADGFAKGLQGSIGSANSWASKIKSVVGAAAKFIAGAAVAMGAAIIGAGVALGKLAMDAAPLEGIGIAFEKMSTRVGLSLDSLRTAAAGTISDFELMRQANVALTGAGEQLGVAFGQALPGLLEAARAAARATGQDVDFLFQSLVSGVKRSSPMLIDNTGLVIKLGEANQAMADELGKSVSELTAEEKQIALLNATLEAGERLTAEFGGGQLTAAEKMAQFKATVQNTKDQIGLALLPILSTVMDVLGGLAERILPDVIAWFEKFAEALGALVNYFVFVFEDGDTLNDWLSHLPEGIQPIVKAIADFIMNLRSLVEYIKFVVEDGDVLNDWLSHLPESWQGVVLAIGQVITWVQDNWPTFRDTIISVFNTIRAWVETNWPTIRDTIINAVQAVHDWFVANWPIIQAVMLTALEVIKIVATWIGENLPVALAAVAAVWEAVLKPALEGLVSFVKDNLVPILFAIAVVVITSVVPAMAAAVVAFLAMAIPIAGLVAALIALGLLWQAHGEQVMTTVEQLKVVIIYALNEAAQFILTTFAQIVTTISQAWFVIQFKTIETLNAMSTAITGAIATWRSNWEMAVTIVTTAWTNIQTAVTTGLTNAVSAIVAKVEAFKTAGADLMAGLKAGILSKVQDIIDAVKGAVRDAIQAARNLLGMDSPSKVFAEIGRSVSEGMAGGISGSAHMPVMATLGMAGSMVESTINNYFNQTVNTRATTPTVVQDFRTLAALAGA